MKIKNYTIFDRVTTKNWDLLRDSSNYNSYYIPKSKEKFLEILKKCNPREFIIDDFIFLIQSYNLNKIISLASGQCNLEYYLMNRLNLLCDVSDNTDSINRIKEFNIFNNAFYLDIKSDFKLNNHNNAIVLLSRIDTEFDDFELINLFNKLHTNKIKYIYFIPAEILNLKTFMIKIKIILIRVLKFKAPVSWGYVRDLKGFDKLWKRHYSILKKTKNSMILVSNDFI